MFSKRLLVAVSPGREEASVLSLARTLGVLGARVTLAHVADVAPAVMGLEGLDPEEVKEAFRQAARAYLAKAQERARGMGLEAETLYLEGPVGPALVQAARAYDGLLAGARDHTLLGALLLGSVALYLVHHLDRPLFLARGVLGEGPVGLLAEEGEAGERAFALALALARALGRPLRLLGAVPHIPLVETPPELVLEEAALEAGEATEERSLLERLAARARAEGVAAEPLFLRERPFALLKEEEARLGLLVLPHHPQALWEEVVFPDTSVRAALHLHRPLVLVP
jgi:nucleotide-binding universal stress UspA family protein